MKQEINLNQPIIKILNFASIMYFGTIVLILPAIKSQLFSYSVEDTDLLSQLSPTSRIVSQLSFLNRSVTTVDLFLTSIVCLLDKFMVGLLKVVGDGSSAFTASFSTSTHLDISNLKGL